MRLRVLLLLLPLLEQAHHVTGLGNPGEIDLGLDLGGRRLLSLSRRGLGRKVFADLFGFIFLDGA